MKHLIIAAFILAITALRPALVAKPLAVIDLDYQPQAGETVVWSPLFQASWDKLQSMKSGPFISVEPENPLITKLSQFTWNKEKVMPEAAYDIYAGPSTKEFAQQTAKAILQKYQIVIDTARIPESPNGHAVYSIMLRDLKFKVPFFKSKKNALSFKSSDETSHDVAFFGTTKAFSDNYGKSIRVLKYTNEGESFLISIQTDIKDEQLLVYLPNEPQSMLQAIGSALEAIKSPLAGKPRSEQDPFIHNTDTIKIPYLSIDSETSFTSSLQGLLSYENEPEHITITAAYQITRFELFEKGARIQVHTGSADDPFGGPPPPKLFTPRNFICDRPFFVFAWKDGAELPYFMTSIDGLSALQPFKTP